MTTRKKPQQQLNSYFTELLTELEEPVISEPVEAETKSKASVEKTSSARVQKLEAEASITPKVPPEPRIKRIAVSPSSTSVNVNNTIVDSVDTATVDTSAHYQSSIVSSQVAKPHITESSNISKQYLPQVKTSAARIEQLPLHKNQVVDDEQRLQQEKLQRLLRNLAPTKNEIEIEPDTQKIIEEKILGHTVDDADIDASLEAMGLNTPYRWQALSSEWVDHEGAVKARPNWAQERFDILLMSVNGVNLAVPLAALDAIYPLEEELTPLFGQAEWFMGLQKTLIGNINVINTTQFVMPERYDKSAENAFKFNVAINGSGWGLAVDDIDQPIAINPDDIRWRVNRAQQPWMAGTVKEHMCVLLDIPTLAEMFTKKHNRHEPELASD